MLNKVINVVGARPNFTNVAPLVGAMNCRPDSFTSLVVHTGQHYDAAMSDAFFRDLGLPEPCKYLVWVRPDTLRRRRP
jgi:UDP-N-acetylglucosamine 2-epimerase (non-hydrolysing)